MQKLITNSQSNGFVFLSRLHLGEEHSCFPQLFPFYSQKALRGLPNICHSLKLKGTSKVPVYKSLLSDSPISQA